MAALRPLVLAFLAALAGCASAPSEPEGPRVEMVEVEFRPAEVRVRVGETVTWINRDPVEHTVTPDNATAWGTAGSGDAYEDWLREGGTWSHAFAAPGTYAYRCIPHAMPAEGGGWKGMVGTVVVEA